MLVLPIVLFFSPRLINTSSCEVERGREGEAPLDELMTKNEEIWMNTSARKMEEGKIVITRKRQRKNY